MEKKDFWLGFLAVLLLLLTAATSCLSRPGVIWTDASGWELEWYEVNPPRNGLRCWIAVSTAGTGYGFSYCEESPEKHPEK